MGLPWTRREARKSSVSVPQAFRSTAGAKSSREVIKKRKAPVLPVLKLSAPLMVSRTLPGNNLLIISRTEAEGGRAGGWQTPSRLFESLGQVRHRPGP